MANDFKIKADLSQVSHTSSMDYSKKEKDTVWKQVLFYTTYNNIPSFMFWALYPRQELLHLENILVGRRTCNFRYHEAQV